MADIVQRYARAMNGEARYMVRGNGVSRCDVRSISKLLPGLSLLLVLTSHVRADTRHTLTIDNQGQEAVAVRLTGPTSSLLEIPSGSNQTITIQPGSYQTYVRYGRPGAYVYVRGQRFTVTKRDSGARITLRTPVPDSCADCQGSEEEFNGETRNST
jgi:hypothetical protein